MSSEKRTPILRELMKRRQGIQRKYVDGQLGWIDLVRPGNEVWVWGSTVWIMGRTESVKLLHPDIDRIVQYLRLMGWRIHDER